MVTVNPLPAFLDALNLEPGDRDPIEAAESALEETEALARAHGVVKAVEYALGGRLDLVLQLPAPVRLLKMFGLTDSSSTLSPGMLEDAGALLADFARQFASYDFNGLMVWLDVSCDDVPGQHEAMDSVISTIRHYRWIYLVRMSNCTELTPLEGVSADVILLPDLPPSKYRRYTGDGYPCVGGGLSRAFWAGETFESYSPGSLYYGDAPADEEPEKVLARLRALP